MTTLKNAYALLIGVGADLPASVRDAQAIATLLKDPKIAGYPEENIQLLTEGEATREHILKAFDTLIEKADENASVLLFYSGHGGTYTDNDILELENKHDQLKPEELNQSHYYWVPNNFDAKNYSTTWVLATELKEKLKALKTRRLIMMLDCCHAEGMTKSSPNLSKSNLKERLTNPEGMIHKIDDGRGMSILSSCRAEELSWIIPNDAVNSVFTTCLLEVLQGKHKENFDEDYVRMTDVINHVMRKVPEVKSIQRPFVTLQMYDDFILSRNSQKSVSRNATATTTTAVNNLESSKEVVTSFRENHGVNAVVFIHGFAGEAHQSFGAIPTLLADETAMDGWDLFPLGFSENYTLEMGKNIWASELDVIKLADNIASSLRHRFMDYKRIALVAHGVGGIALQLAILQLKPYEHNKISHLIFMGVPHLGISHTNATARDEDSKIYSKSGNFMTQLRERWDQAFAEHVPFTVVNAIGTQDNWVPADTSFGALPSVQDIYVAGDHFSMVQPDNQQHDGYQLIVKTLTGGEFANEYTNREEINLLKGDYDAVVRELWSDRVTLGPKGIRNLLFALEGLDRLEDAIQLANQALESNDSLHLLGLLAGRVKRRYLKSMKDADGELSFKLYKQAFEKAESELNNDQMYFTAINLAFLALIHHEDRSEMTKYATLSRKLAQQDPFDSMWKAATIAEASMYLADFEAAIEHYRTAAATAGVREKIFMHTNAYVAYSTLKNTSNDDFVLFLKNIFLA